MEESRELSGFVCMCSVVQLCPTLCNPMDCSLQGSSVHLPSKNTESGCHFPLQGIVMTQGSNPYLPHWQVDSLPLSHLGKPQGL